LKILVGWFQEVDSENTKLNDIAAYLKRNKRAGRCKYTDISTLYSLHTDDIKQHWLSKFIIDDSRINDPKIKRSSLTYLIVSKSYKPTIEDPPLQPELVL
jgi:hypothetical protein